MNKTIITSTVILLLSGCGGSSSSNSEDDISPISVDVPVPENDSTPIVDPISVVETPPSDNVIATPLFAPNPSITSCDGVDYINLINAQSLATLVTDTASGIALDADNAIDNSLTAEGRWETTDPTATLVIDLGYRHQIKEIGTAWYQGDESSTSFDIEISESGTSFTSLTGFSSNGTTESFERFDINDSVARFVRLTNFANTDTNTVSLLEAAVFGCPLDVAIAPLETQTIDTAQFNLNPDATPGQNFDLLTWALDTPEPETAGSSDALRTGETDLDTGHEDEFFFTAADGGMVFKATIGGATTSENTSFTRSELREQLRRGNTSISTQGVNENNWVLGYQPETPRATGGRGGLLTATLKVDEVATSGSEQHEGRFIIGQIHGEDDEPIRLYFKKFADNERGVIYFAHEIRASAANNFDSTDNWFVVVGNDNPNRDQETEPFKVRAESDNPEQGIALGEIFSYEIDQTGSVIDVIVRRGDLEGPIIGHTSIDMAELGSGYDVVEEWNYFKAGTYVQNNTGDDDDVYQTTFYALSNTHEENTLIAEQQGLNLGSASGNQFARITDSSATDTGELRYELPSSLAQGRLELRFTRTDDDDGNTDGFITLFDSGTDNAGSILDLRVRDNSFQTRFPQTNIDTDIASVTVNSFQTAVITWEHPNGTSSGSLPNVTVAIDGIDIISGTTTATSFTPTGSFPAGGVDTVSFRFGSNSAQVSAAAMLAIDDIRIYSDTTGTNLVFSDDFESYDNGESLDQSPYDSASSEVTIDTEQ